MKLMRVGKVGAERPVLVDAHGNWRDLSAHVPDIDLEKDPGVIAKIAAISPQTLPLIEQTLRIGPPIARVGKFIAIGLNYKDHAEEAGLPIPGEPVVFSKATSCVVGPNDDVIIPRGSEKTDWEVELGVIIGKRASYVKEGDALGYVAGYVVVHDVSERAFQNERGGTWDKGKGCDTFGPIGPWLVTADEVGDPQTLDMWLDVNGEKMQRGSTRTMIFPCATLVSYVSQFMTLMPGDLITTGTPPGVGMGQKPPKYLRAGDAVSLGISRLGEQRQRVVAYS
jgi:2,4-diketo-3-deoxy-L-fuconate hydrolase